MNNTIIKTVAAMCAGAAIVLGVNAAAGKNDSAAGAAAQRPAAAVAAAVQPQGRAPGFGAQATGADADKAATAATAQYAGTVEGVMQLPDGSYVVHVITSGGEVHVAVSSAFAVTGTQQGPPGLQGGPPSGTPPAAAAPGSTSS
jgi:hypothetical protein